MPRPVRRRLPALLVAAALVFTVSATATTAGGQPASPPPPTFSPRIVGGDVAPTGTWPSQAALQIFTPPLYPSSKIGLCGATVIAPDWALTAGHCVHDSEGKAIPVAKLHVLAGTQDLTSGGELEQVVEARTAPGWRFDTLENDVAVVRLDHPVTAPAMPLVPQGLDLAPGTDLVTTGWGNTSTTKSAFPSQLNEVHVPLVSPASCQAAYAHAANKFFPASMICAGLLTKGGKDSCNGDSGGPISALIGGSWTEIGTVSWGLGCAQPAYPGVYSRLSVFSNWIKSQIRYGAQPDVAAFVRQQYLDFTGAGPDLQQLFFGEVALRSGSLSSYVAALEASPGWQQSAASVARLYLAAFDRNPDTSGMNAWVGALEHGSTLGAIAHTFVTSSEFLADYGALDDAQFVNQVYQNVLGRPADLTGGAYWTGRLESGALLRSQVLLGFSNSNEFRTRTRASTDVTTTIYALLRRVPTDAEYHSWTPQPNLSLVRSILGSVAYAARF